LTTQRILVGAIAGAHGVRGEVRIKSFTAEPEAIGRYGPVEDESGARRFKLRVRGEAKGMAIARLEGIADRNAAEALKGLRLYVPRARLPKLRRGEWYVADLVGLRAETAAGVALGVVKGVQNYGAGDVLEIERNGTSEFLPFTKRVVPEIDIDGGRLIIDPPADVDVSTEAQRHRETEPQS
jgi:16S rRNA processing protein RimM